MSCATREVTAVNADNQFVEANGRLLAYRSVGNGKPIVLCTRFRGNLDTWDPAFIDALAANGFRAITFDYSGLGLSTGRATYSPPEMAADPRDLIAALGLKQVVIAGWSLGGLVAQVVAVERHPGITHAVLIGTGPPGPMIKRSEQIFFDTAAIEHNSFEDEVVLFFEPKSQASRAEAQRSSARIAARRAQLSKPVPIDFARSHLGSEPREAIFPSDAVLAALKETTIPILHVGGDHDIVFPIENWYALNPHLPTLRLLTYPSAGHGPHHQHPEETARHIAAFVHTRDRQLKQEELQP